MKLAPAFLIVGFLALEATSAMAQDAPADRLPGVDGGYTLVDRDALTAEPEPDDTPGRPGSYRVGNWDVTISGSVSFQIGTGRTPDGR